MRRLYILFALLLLLIAGCTEQPSTNLQTVSRKAGLGDTVEAIEAAWGKGYKKEAVQSDGSRNVVIGFSDNVDLGYCVKCPENFGDPERLGHLSGSAKLLGSSQDKNPAKEEFFESIRDLMPKDSSLKSTYRSETPSVIPGNPPARKELFNFTSSSLGVLPDVQKSLVYSQDGLREPVGSFCLAVNYDMDDPSRVYNFSLFLGDGRYDSNVMKKVDHNPFSK